MERLREIQKEILELLGEAAYLIKCHGSKMDYERAKSYWLAHIQTALTRDHGYLGGSMVTMEDTIQDMEKED